MDHSKIDRLLQLLLCLAGNRKFTVKELAGRFEVSERTVMRYFETFRSSGFVLQSQEGYYKLQTHSPAHKTLQKLIHFSEDEASILYQTLANIEGTSPVKERLLKKLHVIYDFHILQQQHPDALAMIQQLRDGILKKQQLLITDYRSSNSARVDDRLLECFEFLPDYEGVWAYEPESKQVKQFRLSRMGSMESNGSGWQYENLHQLPFCDAFGMAAPQPLSEVQLRLNLKACNLLLEEFPRTKEQVTNDGEYFMLQIPVANFYGIGRFVMGLPGQVEVLGPEAFKNFLREEVKKRMW